VVAHSSGNHAQGVAFAARALGVKATIVMPGTAPKVKLDATRLLGAEVVLVGPASEDRIQRAEELEHERGLVPVPPYNDEKIIAGQGTIGMEFWTTWKIRASYWCRLRGRADQRHSHGAEGVAARHQSNWRGAGVYR